MTAPFLAARRTARQSPLLLRVGWVCEAADGWGDYCAGYGRRCCQVNAGPIPSGEQVWIEPADYFGEADAYCRRCAFEKAGRFGQWEAGFRRRRPWVGLDLQVLQSLRRDAKRTRRKARRRRFGRG